MNNKFQLGKYEFFPYEDNKRKGSLEEFEELLKTVKKSKKNQDDIQDKSIKRKKMKGK